MSNGTAFDEQLRSAMLELANKFPLNGLDVQATLDDVQATLESVTRAAVELIDGVDYADVLLIDQDRFDSMAPTDPIAKELDAVQQQLREGPCLQAASADSIVRCTDLRTEPRWPQFAAEATKLGVHSMLSFHIFTHRGGLGALNLHGRNPQTFTQETEALAAMLATHAALALAAANTHHQFTSALASRDHIGQAKGILMERFDIDAVQAFDLLIKLSQNNNIPIRKLAERVIDAR